MSTAASPFDITKVKFLLRDFVRTLDNLQSIPTFFPLRVTETAGGQEAIAHRWPRNLRDEIPRSKAFGERDTYEKGQAVQKIQADALLLPRK